MPRKKILIPETAPPKPPASSPTSSESEKEFTVDDSASGQRLDSFLTRQLGEVSRSRVQLLIDQQRASVDGHPAKASYKLRLGQHIVVHGEAILEPLHASPEAIPLTILHEDPDLAVIDKPAGMMVHAGSGSTDDARNRGTLVNALLHHFQNLSSEGGNLRPGVVHRLDKQTSGIILVAKNDWTHRKLAAMFAARQMRKTYIALVHGNVIRDSGTITAAISRDSIRRTRMTTRHREGRSAVSHYRVLERIAGPYGPFTLVEVRIETGRTHQIRVHMSSIGHPVAGDSLYGAPAVIVPIPDGQSRGIQRPRRLKAQSISESPTLNLERNFLHAAQLEFIHPRSGELLQLTAELPPALTAFLAALRPASPQ